MKNKCNTTTIILVLAALFILLLPQNIKADSNKKETVVKLKFAAGDNNYLPAFKKKIKTIDISFSVVINGKYKSHNLETNETETEDKIETIAGGGETDNTTLEKEGLPTKKLTCSGNTFTLSYNTKETYISSEGTYFLTGTVSSDGKSIETITVTYTANSGTSAKWSYNVTANNIPWVGSLGPNFDKFKRNYGFKYPTEGKPFSHVEYEKQTNPSEVWSYTLTAESIAVEQKQNFDIYFTFEK